MRLPSSQGSDQTLATAYDSSKPTSGLHLLSTMVPMKSRLEQEQVEEAVKKKISSRKPTYRAPWSDPDSLCAGFPGGASAPGSISNRQSLSNLKYAGEEGCMEEYFAAPIRDPYQITTTPSSSFSETTYTPPQLDSHSPASSLGSAVSIPMAIERKDA